MVEENGSPSRASAGATPSERYLARLARRSFLSLWSYSNLYTDEGRRNSKGQGKELCDLLVVFGRHVLVFSDKHCEFPGGPDLQISWARWYRRAIEKSVRQVLGARNWIARFPARVYLDPGCERRFPLQLPRAESARFHLFAVTRGSYEACHARFAEASTGSLMIDTSVVGDEHHSRPFTVGRVLPNGPYVHVLDELTLEVLLNELDTIKDLVEYLQRKEELLTHPTRSVMATGEEQLVSLYLKKLGSDGHHSFGEFPDDVDGVYIEEGHWEDFVQNPQYIAKKKADEISYAWDRLIEHLTSLGEAGLTREGPRDMAVMEPALRVLASEPRLARRQLADQLIEALSKEVPPGSRFLRVGYSKQSTDTAYVFLVLPQPPFVKTYDEYREGRKAILLAACRVAKLRMPRAERIVGIASEPLGTQGASEDLVLLEFDGDTWGPEQEVEARRLQQEGQILLDERVEYYEQHETEYPPAFRESHASSPAKRLLERARVQRMEKLRKASHRRRGKQST